jgi:adenylate kinase
MTAKTIIVTGISGSGSRNFCARYNPPEKKVKIYHTGDRIYELAQKYSSTSVPKENLLHLAPDMLASLRDKAFEELIDKIEKDKKTNDMIFIDTHAQFCWDDIYENAYDWKYLNAIPADMFVTIINKPSQIKQKQLASAMGKAQTHDLRDLLMWQNVEVNVTKGWAANFRKPMYVFSHKQNPAIIDPLLVNEFLIYSSFPMTDATPADFRRIDGFKERLRGLRKKIDGYETPMLDPADIDVEPAEGISQREKQAIDRHTVHRDLNWDVEQSTDIVAFYPNKKIDLSKGVSDECTTGHRTGKNVYVISPRARLSPFMYIAKGIFRKEDDFFDFYEPQMRESLEFLRRK